MDSSSLASLLTLLIFNNVIFSNIEPVASVHVSGDLYTKSRNSSLSWPRRGRGRGQARPVPALFVIALHLKLPFIPSYLGQSGSTEDMKHGLNFASAGAGMIFSSGSELGQHISFTQQIQQVMDTFQRFTLTMGEIEAADLISDSVFYISIGTNDYIHYYLPDVSGVQSKYVSWNFTKFLARTMKQEIKNLYNAKVRRVVVMGLAPIGCAPYYLWQYNSNNGECVKTINDMIMEFNFEMRYTIKKLNRELPDANVIFCDAYLGSMDIMKNFDQYGMACGNASNHLWWDQFHPTAAVNEILADNVWSGLHTNMCYPMNMKEMIAQRVR
nr:GDSL esterase/lipase 7-like [Tanacetum cinerariifolium]